MNKKQAKKLSKKRTPLIDPEIEERLVRHFADSVPHLGASLTVQQVEENSRHIFAAMEHMFRRGFPDVTLAPDAIARIEAAKAKARDIMRRAALPGLYQ